MVTRELNGLSLEAARLRAARVRLVLTDCDGVLTDGGVYYDAEGEVCKRFSIRDGMGVERLRNAGIETGIMTGERSECVARRAEKLGIRRLYLGAKDKAALLDIVLEDADLRIDQVAFIGDDVNDLALLARLFDASLTAAPKDAMPAVLASVHYRSALGGGHGAFRDFAELLLELNC